MRMLRCVAVIHLCFSAASCGGGGEVSEAEEAGTVPERTVTRMDASAVAARPAQLAPTFRQAPQPETIRYDNQAPENAPCGSRHGNQVLVFARDRPGQPSQLYGVLYVEYPVTRRVCVDGVGYSNTNQQILIPAGPHIVDLGDPVNYRRATETPDVRPSPIVTRVHFYPLP
jgi:hypothetical protein